MRSMSPIQGFPPTELVINDITGSDQFPDDLKLYEKAWDDYRCLCRKWEDFGSCHWLFWIDNHQFSKPPTHVKEKIKSILVDLEGRGQFLVQFWEAIALVNSKEIELTGRNQPFGVNSTNIELCAYGYMSQFDDFGTTSGPEHFELPSRVLRNLRAECTPERRAYQIPPRDAAVGCNITASLAFPLFEFNRCVGVIEIVTNSDHPTNELFRDIVSKYSRDPYSGTCIHLNEQNDKKEEALEEIKKSLEEVRRIHDIPLAQTWIPCKICDALLSGPTVLDSLGNPSSFLNTRQFQCLAKGQGIAGKAFLSNNLEFSEDFSHFGITEYPFTLVALHCGLAASFAVCLRSSGLNKEDDIYVVEFFLPPDYVEFSDWRTTASSLLSTMRRRLKSVSIASGCEIGKDLPINNNLAENGGETVRLDSSNQEKKENAATHAENNIRSYLQDTNLRNNNEDYTQETNMGIMSSQQKVQHRKAGIPISLELLEQHFGMKLEDAAESIGVSRSTLKRACREYKITWWPSRKRKNKDNHSIPKKSLQCAAVEKQTGETSEAPISDPSGKQHMETYISTELHDQDISSVTIKAKFGAEDFIKFKLPVTSGMREFQHQVEKRLHLKDGTYSVRYQDDDNDSILVVCDEDLQDYICNSKAMGRKTITVSVQPITNFSNYPL